MLSNGRKLIVMAEEIQAKYNAHEVSMMRKERTYPKTRMLLILAGLPWDLILWGFLVIFRLFWGKRLWWSEWSLWTELKPKSWPARTWYRRKVDGHFVRNPMDIAEVRGIWRTWGGTTLGHGGWFGPGVPGDPDMDTECEFHEHIHVEQYEVFSLMGVILAVLFAPVLAFTAPWQVAVILPLVLWAGGGLLGFACGWLVALCRGERAYRGSAHEEHAYSAAHNELVSYMKKKQGL